MGWKHPSYFRNTRNDPMGGVARPRSGSKRSGLEYLPPSQPPSTMRCNRLCPFPLLLPNKRAVVIFHLVYGNISGQKYFVKICLEAVKKVCAFRNMNTWGV